MGAVAPVAPICELLVVRREDSVATVEVRVGLPQGVSLVPDADGLHHPGVAQLLQALGGVHRA